MSFFSKIEEECVVTENTCHVDMVAVSVNDAPCWSGDLDDGGGLIVVRDGGHRGCCKHTMGGRVHEMSSHYAKVRFSS